MKTTNQQKLRELINKACPELLELKKSDHSLICNENSFSKDLCNCGAEKPIILEHLLIALGEKELIFDIDESSIVYDDGLHKRIVISYDLQKPPLEQSEETLTELINLLS